MIAKDETLKNTASLAETTYLIPENLGLTTQIGVPTLRVITMIGSCARATRVLRQRLPRLFRRCSRRVFGPSSAGRAGHDVALELNNQDGFDAMADWLNDFFPN